MTEIPLCELALSCDNLLCDANGKPPSPVLVVYTRHSKGVCIKYGTTEIVEVSLLNLILLHHSSIYLYINM